MRQCWRWKLKRMMSLETLCQRSHSLKLKNTQLKTQATELVNSYGLVNSVAMANGLGLTSKFLRIRNPNTLTKYIFGLSIITILVMSILLLLNATYFNITIQPGL